MQRRTKKSKKRGKTKPKRQGNRGQVVTTTDLILSSGPRDVVPPIKYVNLNYIDNTIVRNNVGSQYLVYSMRLNSVYDPDTALLTGGISGFSYWANFYNYYRVIGAEVSWSVVNKESFPVHVGFVASPAPLTISGRAQAQNALENAEAAGPAHLSAATGQDRIMIKRRYRLPTIWGNTMQYLADDNFASIVTNNPVFLIICQFVAFATSNFVNGIDTDLRIRFRVQFYGRVQIEG